MTSPNKPTRSDILAARERVKLTNHPAHYGDIDAGYWDNWNQVQSALRDMLREREGEAVEE